MPGSKAAVAGRQLSAHPELGAGWAQPGLGNWAGGCSPPTHSSRGHQHCGVCPEPLGFTRAGQPHRLKHPLRLQRGLDFIKPEHENTKHTRILLSTHKRVQNTMFRGKNHLCSFCSKQCRQDATFAWKRPSCCFAVLGTKRNAVGILQAGWVPILRGWTGKTRGPSPSWCPWLTPTARRDPGEADGLPSLSTSSVQAAGAAFAPEQS